MLNRSPSPWFHADPSAPGLLHRLREAPHSVAIVRASRIGDFVCATPAIRSLRAALPGATFTLIGLPFVRELVERSPYLDGFVPFPGFPGMADQFFDARRATDFLRTMQDEHFDLAIQLHGSGVYSNAFTLLLGARVTAGFIRHGDDAGRLDAALPMPESGHESHRLLAFSSFLGAPSCGASSEFPLWPADRHAATELLDANPELLPRPRIGLHPWAREPAKRWGTAAFANMATTLRRRVGGTIILLGGADDAGAAISLARLIGPPVLNLVSRASLPVTGAVIERLSVLITNDSGPAHIGYALGTPTVTIFITTDPVQWGPTMRGPFRIVKLSPADGPRPGRCGGRDPMFDEVRQVLAAAEAVLGDDW